MTLIATPTAPIATVTMNPSIDQHILIDRLVKDDAIRARDIRRDPGGKGINVSRVLSELGSATLAFGLTGGGAGYIVKSLLHERGIAFESVDVLEETRINFIFTDRSDRTQTRVSSPGPWVTLDEADRLAALVLGQTPMPPWWVLGGSLPRGIPVDFYARLIRDLGRKGARCFLDADDDALRVGIEARPYGVKPNENELARLAGRELRDETQILEAARDVVAAGVEIVAVTLGGEGALVVTPSELVRARPPAVEVLSKVGAGDAFLAGFVLALSRGETLDQAARLGVAAGTAAVIHEGTQLCRKEDVERLLPRVTAEMRPLAPRESESAAHVALLIDVVCGTQFDPTLTSFATLHEGRRYRFCSLACQRQFEAHPDPYAARANELSAPQR
jgi:1-phosphofructokinase family hexose kinase